MLKTFAIIIFLVLLSCSASAQQNNNKPAKVEQLIWQLEQLDQNDKNLLPILTQLIKETWRSNPVQAEDYGNKALALTEIHDWPEQEATFLIYLSRVYLDRRELIVAETMISRGIKAAKATDDERALTLNLFNQAILFQLTDKLIFALNTYRELEAVYKRTDNNKALGNVYNNISNIQSKVGDLDGAFESLQMAMPLLEKHSSKEKYANSVSNVGRIFSQMNDYAQAERNYKKALSLFDPAAHPKQALEINQLLGVVYNKLGIEKNALKHFKMAEEIGKRHNMTGKLIIIYFELVDHHLLLNQVTEADSYITKAQQIISVTISSQIVDLLPYYQARVAAAKEQWSIAETYIDPLVKNKIFDQRFFENHELIRTAVKLKTRLGKTKEANQLLLEILSDYNEFNVTNNTTILAQYAELYRTSEKEKQITLLTKQSIEQENLRLLEQKKSRQNLFIFVVSSLILIGIALLIYQKVCSLKREQAVNLALMDEKKQFFADISHELRTPLAVFKLKMEELEYNISDNPKDVYKLLHQRIDSFNGVINDISMLAQNDKGELELNCANFELAPFFESCYSELKLLSRQFNLETQFTNLLSENSTANIDGARLHQVLTNLFSNSCRYTDSPGRVSLKVSERSSKLIIEIADSAPGLPAEQRKQIFERLYRVDKSRSRKFGGSGLGLSICKDLIKAHQGSIYCDESELGGISMLITLPLN